MSLETEDNGKRIDSDFVVIVENDEDFYDFVTIDEDFFYEPVIIDMSEDQHQDTFIIGVEVNSDDSSFVSVIDEDQVIFSGFSDSDNDNLSDFFELKSH